MKFNICVAIPVKSGDLKENEATVKRVLSVNPELVEFRFDYINDIVKLTPDLVNGLLNFVRPHAQTIFTFRDFSEGGQMELNEYERLRIINMLIEAQPEYLDLEMSTKLDLLRDLINLAHANNIKLIFSYHDFEKTPMYEEALNIFERFKNKLLDNHIVDFLSFKKITYKMIFTAKKFEDNLIPIKLCKNISEKERDQGIISFCMGEEGIFSRIASVKFGSLFTFGSYGDKTAPGQMSIDLIREFHKILFNIS